jgi:ribosomal-protein-alanine N-acetyltransferase
VLPYYQRRGIGRELLGSLEASAITASTFLIKLKVRAGNLAARNFYTSLGYREDADMAGYDQGREAAVWMTRDLPLDCPRLES